MLPSLVHTKKKFTIILRKKKSAQLKWLVGVRLRHQWLVGVKLGKHWDYVVNWVQVQGNTISAMSGSVALLFAVETGNDPLVAQLIKAGLL